jgi:predicted metal-binding protein
MSRTICSLIGSGALLITLLTACDGTPTAAPTTPTTDSTRSSATPQTSEPLPPTTTAESPPNTTARPSIAAPNPGSHAPPRALVRACTSVDLEVSLGAAEGTAGQLHRALVFTNTGRHLCTIQGFPGVSYVAGDDGHQVGQAANRDGLKGLPVTLTPVVSNGMNFARVSCGGRLRRHNAHQHAEGQHREHAEVDEFERCGGCRTRHRLRTGLNDAGKKIKGRKRHRPPTCSAAADPDHRSIGTRFSWRKVCGRFGEAPAHALGGFYGRWPTAFTTAWSRTADWSSMPRKA